MPASRRKYWSGRPDLNRRPPAPKVNSKTLSSCLVYVFRASYITVYGGIRRLLFPNCSQLPMETRPRALHPNVFLHVLGNVVVRGVWLHRRKVHAAADYETNPKSSKSESTGR